MTEPTHPSRQMIRHSQLRQLRRLIAALREGNRLYRPMLEAAGIDDRIESLEAFAAHMPFTTKAQLVADQHAHPPYGTNLTYPLERYTRLHQTSGTTGEPLRWLDTDDSWRWMLDNWSRVYAAAGVVERDRVLFAFSFGPFLGFWTAFESAERLGCLCLPGGGLSTSARLRLMLDNAATAVCCTPTYALRLAEVASEQGMDLSRSAVRALIVAGEPGGSVASVRKRIEDAWGGAARVFDHHGMTETGPVTYPCPARPDVLHVIEQSYIAEVIDPATGRTAPAGAGGELALTNLGRIGSPLLRYRTGDCVQPDRRGEDQPCACGTHDLTLLGGILGRSDDMVVVRGVNVFPSAIDQIVRAHPQVTEYRVEVTGDGAMVELAVTIEPASVGEAEAEALCRAVERDLKDALHLRVPVRPAEPNALPRFELKARRWVRHA